MSSERKLNKYFLSTLIIVLFLVIFGPFQYQIYSNTAIFYFLFCSFLFYLGLSNRKVIIKSKKERVIKKYILKKTGIYILFFLDILVIFSFIFFTRSIISAVGGEFSFATEDYRYLLEGRNIFEKFVEAALHLAAPIFIFYEFAENKESYKLAYRLSFFVYWLPPIAYLISGGRWSTFFYLIMYFFIEKNSKLKSKKKIAKKNIVKKILFITLAVILLSAVYSLFAERGYIDIYNNYLFVPGDILLRSWADNLVKVTNGAITTLFKISHYFSESISAFSYLFLNYSNQKHLFGLYSFSIITYLMMPFGYSSNGIKEIVLSYPGAGKYMTFLHGYIIDWGIFVTPIAVLLTGLLFSTIERNKETNVLCKMLYFYLMVMCIVAPIYDIWGVASINMDMFFILVMYYIFKKLNFFRIIKKELI